jgi:beta-glucanase (GH16 family)
LNWDKDFIRLYLDNELLNEVDLSKTINPDGFNPFNQPQYILLNLAIGGDHGGDPSQTVFPIAYEVDYVRIYQKE